MRPRHPTIRNSTGFQPTRQRAAVGQPECRSWRHPAQGTGPFAQALAQIGKDLQSKDLDGAQQALSSLQQQQQARGHHRHHHGGISQSQNSTDANDPNSDADTVSIGIQVTSTFDTANKVDLKA